MTLIASFLAGSLLSLLIPLLLLIAVVVWYWLLIRRGPEAAGAEASGQAGASAAAPGVSVSDELDRPPSE